MSDLDDFERKLSELGNALNGDELKRKVHRQGLRVQNAAKLNCPERRFGSGGGALRQSIHIATEKQGNSIESEIYTNSEYGVYVEFGTGPTGQANHNGISPDIDPVYSQSGWMIPADAMSPDDAEQYGFGIARKNGEIIGYYTKGQVAQPFMYPALNDLRDSITENLQRDFEEIITRVLS